MRTDRPNVRAARSAAFVTALLATLLLCGNSPGSARADETRPHSDISTDSSAAEQLLEARQASARDDHDAAIAAYRRALELEPSLIDSVAPALGAQLTWAGRHVEAIAEFQRYLSRHPERHDARKTMALAQAWSGDTKGALRSYETILRDQPDDVDARFGEARMLSWLGHTTSAVHRYEALLHEHPEHSEARLNLAMVHNWRGDHEKAGRLFGDLTLERPSNREAWEGLAWAREWGGRSDDALRSVSAQNAAGARSDGSDALARKIADDWITRASTSFDVAHDSDEFTATSWRLDLELPVGYRGHARAGVLRNQFTRDEHPDVDDTWLTAAGDYRIARRVLASAALQYVIERPEDADYTPLTSELGLAWFLGDRVRLDAGYSHVALFTYEELPERITGDLVSGGVSWRPQYLTTLIVSADHGTYSDGNGRVNVKGRARYWLLPRRPRTWIEVGTQYLDYEEQPGHGLWTPEQYRSIYGRCDFEIHPDGEWVLLGGIDGGWAKEKPGDFAPYFAYYGGGVLRYRWIRLDLRAGHSDSNVENGRGYRRTYGSVALTTGF